MRGSDKDGIGIVNLPRSSGVLLHVTSLPGGRLGSAAYSFVDWLAAAGQSWWQVLPLGPPDRSGSPYTSSSAFAGWPALLAEPDAAVSTAELDAFRAAHAFWVDDWERFTGSETAADQVRFEREWSDLRRYAGSRGVRLIGDIPLYVGARSADHLAHPDIFQRGFVAGAPPDALSRTGQLWGNPLYDWPALRRHGYRWWIERLRRASQLFDLARIDHFRGFVAYWSVPARARKASAGRWRRGPGRAVFEAAQHELGSLALIAEDLGVITPPVERLRLELGLPGMAVLQFGFGGGPRNPHRPANHVELLVVYTGTHDTETAVGWWDSLSPRARAASGLDPAEPQWSLIELALKSPAALSIVPAQDVLGLGSEARMNRPGVTDGNWRWRLEQGALTGALAARLREATARNGRMPLLSGQGQARPRGTRAL
ncbi:MAG: 4-alpha-glucanotransferase [Gaiellales bacterium]|nr:4-alpha-glucanotransferase [Gaiellales bacterium]